MSDAAFDKNQWAPEIWDRWCVVCETRIFEPVRASRVLLGSGCGCASECHVCITCLKRVVALLESDGASPTAA